MTDLLDDELPAEWTRQRRYRLYYISPVLKREAWWTCTQVESGTRNLHNYFRNQNLPIPSVLRVETRMEYIGYTEWETHNG